MLASAVVLISNAISIPYAWLVTRTDLPWRRFWAVAGAMPLAFPSYIAAFTLVSLLGPRGAVATAAGVTLPEIAYGWSGALISLAFFSYPYVYLLLVAAIRGLDPLAEEAARSLGRTPLQVFTGIVVPQLRAPVAAGSLIITLYVLSDFGAVSIVRFDTLTTSIYDAYRGLFDRNIAALLASLLAGMTMVLLALEWAAVRRIAPSRERVARDHALLPLGHWKLPALLFTASVTAIGVALPVAAITGWSIRAIFAGRAVVDLLPAAHSLTVSLGAAIVCTALSIPVAVWAVRGGSLSAVLVERLTFSGYALPGIVVGLALVFATIRLARPLYQTTILLVVAYVIRFLPEAVAATRSALVALAPHFEEAARSLGHGSLSVLRRVTIPMIRPGLLAGAGLVFLTAMKELPATLILRPTGFETLATRIWAETTLSAWSDAAIPSLMLLVVSAIPLWAFVIRPAVGGGR